jgi:hypothetical protein
MVSSGVPDELPEEVTAKAIRKEARQNQNDLVKRLGERLGISALGGKTAAATTSIGGSVAEAEMQRKIQKRRENLGIGTDDSKVDGVMRAGPYRPYPIIPGVKVR